MILKVGPLKYRLNKHKIHNSFLDVDGHSLYWERLSPEEKRERDVLHRYTHMNRTAFGKNKPSAMSSMGLPRWRQW